MQREDNYIIKTQLFEGPFDLLLFFIERDELDINDIPISKITDDFLSYIKTLESLNIDVASEFILVAATLMRIKAKMLIPRKEIDEEGNEIDPREELKQRLLEYMQYKSVIEELKDLEEERSLRSYRGSSSYELKQIANKALVDIELEKLTLSNLFSTFKRLLERYEAQGERTVHRIINYNYTIEEQQSYIMQRVRPGERSSFKAIFGTLENRIHAIVTFLSLLELLNQQKIKVIQGAGANNFWLEVPSEEAA